MKRKPPIEDYRKVFLELLNQEPIFNSDESDAVDHPFIESIRIWVWYNGRSHLIDLDQGDIGLFRQARAYYISLCHTLEELLELVVDDYQGYARSLIEYLDTKGS